LDAKRETGPEKGAIGGKKASMRGRRDSVLATGPEAAMKRERTRASKEEAAGMGLPEFTRILAGAAEVPRDFVAALYGRAAPEDLVHLKSNPPPLPVDDIAEAIQFLEWLIDNNFTLLGVRDYACRAARGRARSRADAGDRARHLARPRRAGAQRGRRGGKVVTVTPEHCARSSTSRRP
jgi:NAD-specific glutamate dehydrogenase